MSAPRCPIHDMPDCSPLLNGCDWPTRQHPGERHSWRQKGPGGPEVCVKCGIPKRQLQVDSNRRWRARRRT